MPYGTVGTILFRCVRKFPDSGSRAVELPLIGAYAPIELHNCGDGSPILLGTLVLSNCSRRPFAGWVNQFHEPMGKPLFYIVMCVACASSARICVLSAVRSTGRLPLWSAPFLLLRTSHVKSLILIQLNRPSCLLPRLSLRRAGAVGIKMGTKAVTYQPCACCEPRSVR